MGAEVSDLTETELRWRRRNLLAELEAVDTEMRERFPQARRSSGAE